MIKIHSISYINNKNYYNYIFYEYFGDGCFNGCLNGNGFGNGFGDEYKFGFGLFNGNGSSFSSNYLIENYKQND